MYEATSLSGFPTEVEDMNVQFWTILDLDVDVVCCISPHCVTWLRTRPFSTCCSQLQSELPAFPWRTIPSCVFYWPSLRIISSTVSSARPLPLSHRLGSRDNYLAQDNQTQQSQPTAQSSYNSVLIEHFWPYTIWMFKDEKKIVEKYYIDKVDEVYLSRQSSHTTLLIPHN